MSAIHSQSVVLGGGAEPLRVGPARIEWEGTRITRVVEGADPAGALSLGDTVISPSFVNSHVHLALHAMRGLTADTAMAGNVVEDLWFVIEAAMTDEDIRAFTRVGAQESLLAGVGCVWDHYYAGRGVAEALRDVGLSGVVAPTLQDVSGPGVARLEAELENTLSILDNPRFSEAGITAALGPHATDTVSDALWRRLVDLAEAHELPIHVHLAQSLEEVERAHAVGVRSPVDRLRRAGVLDSRATILLVHGLYVSDADLTALDPERHVLGYTPFSQLQFGYPAHVASWAHAGFRVVIGTDAAASNDGASVQQELRLAAHGGALATTHGADHARFRASGSLEDARAIHRHRHETFSRRAPFVTADRLLAMAWELPGSLAPRLPVGRIQEGYLANLAVWDREHPSFWPGLDPLRSLALGDTGQALTGMLVAGRWVGEPGALRESLVGSPEWRAARREARERLDALTHRVFG